MGNPSTWGGWSRWAEMEDGPERGLIRGRTRSRTASGWVWERGSRRGWRNGAHRERRLTQYDWVDGCCWRQTWEDVFDLKYDISRTDYQGEVQGRPVRARELSELVDVIEFYSLLFGGLPTTVRGILLESFRTVAEDRWRSTPIGGGWDVSHTDETNGEWSRGTDPIGSFVHLYPLHRHVTTGQQPSFRPLSREQCLEQKRRAIEQQNAWFEEFDGRYEIHNEPEYWSLPTAP